MFLVCREGEEDEHGPLPILGASAAKPLPWLSMLWEDLNFHTSNLKACQWASPQHKLSLFQRLQIDILFHVGFLNFLN